MSEQALPTGISQDNFDTMKSFYLEEIAYQRLEDGFPDDYNYEDYLKEGDQEIADLHCRVFAAELIYKNGATEWNTNMWAWAGTVLGAWDSGDTGKDFIDRIEFNEGFDEENAVAANRTLKQFWRKDDPYGDAAEKKECAMRPWQ